MRMNFPNRLLLLLATVLALPNACNDRRRMEKQWYTLNLNHEHTCTYVHCTYQCVCTYTDVQTQVNDNMHCVGARVNIDQHTHTYTCTHNCSTIQMHTRKHNGRHNDKMGIKGAHVHRWALTPTLCMYIHGYSFEQAQCVHSMSNAHDRGKGSS